MQNYFTLIQAPFYPVWTLQIMKNIPYKVLCFDELILFSNKHGNYPSFLSVGQRCIATFSLRGYKMDLFDFYRKAGDYAAPDPSALDRAGELGEKHAHFYNRIVWISCVFGVMGAVLGIFTSVGFARDSNSGKELEELFLIPFMLGAAGLLFGVALGCLFAPSDFLKGPVGKKWMKLIGTKNVLIARITCLIFGLIIVAPFVWVAILIATSAK